MAINVKAQASKLFNNVKDTPIAKGIKDVLYVDGLFTNAKMKAFNDMNDKAVKGINFIKNGSLEDVSVGDFTINGSNGDEVFGAFKAKMAEVDKMNPLDVENENLRRSIEKSMAKDKELGRAHRETILNVAKDNLVNGSAPKGETMQDLLTRSTREVNGGATIMTPINAAKEYYGTPFSSVVSGIENSDWNGALKSAGVLGGRVTASAFAVGGTAMLATGAVNVAGSAVKGTVNMAKSGIDRMRGNEYER